MIDIKTFLAGYIGCALWAETDCRDEGGTDWYRLDDEFDDVSLACRAAMAAHCADFIRDNSDDLEQLKALEGCDDWRLGFLFWLNRNGHGSGFWDETQHEVGERLSDACRPYGSFDLYGDFEAGVVKSHHYG